MKFLLDTNICIYIIKRKPISVISRFKTLQTSDIFISSITIAELEYGASKSQAFERNRTALQQFLMPFEILEFDQQDAQVYGKIRAYLEKKGEMIGSLDALIAAQAISKDVTLVSNNAKEFIRAPNLKLENWVE